jgi:hypothetical protein
MLTERYGEPTESEETFQSRVQPTDDNSKMHEVRMNRYNFYSFFRTDKGVIYLSIRTSNMNAFIGLAYYDGINNENIRTKAIDDL